MAVSLLGTQIDSSFSGGASAAISFTVDGAADFLEIQWLSYNSVSNITSFAWNSVAMTQQVTAVPGGDTVNDCAIYGLVAPSTGAHTLAVNFSPNCPFGGVFIAKYWSGVDQTTPVNGTNSFASTTPASPETLAITVTAGGYASDAICITPTPTAGGSQVQDQSTTFGSETTASSHLAAATAMSWTYSGTSGNTAHAVIAIKAAGGAAPTADKPGNMLLMFR